MLSFFIIAYLFIYSMRDYLNSKNEAVFWDDYLEIIEIEMNRRSMKESKMF